MELARLCSADQILLEKLPSFQSAAPAQPRHSRSVLAIFEIDLLGKPEDYFLDELK